MDLQAHTCTHMRIVNRHKHTHAHTHTHIHKHTYIHTYRHYTHVCTTLIYMDTRTRHVQTYYYTRTNTQTCIQSLFRTPSNVNTETCPQNCHWEWRRFESRYFFFMFHQKVTTCNCYHRSVLCVVFKTFPPSCLLFFHMMVNDKQLTKNLFTPFDRSIVFYTSKKRCWYSTSSKFNNLFLDIYFGVDKLLRICTDYHNFKTHFKCNSKINS